MHACITLATITIIGLYHALQVQFSSVPLCLVSINVGQVSIDEKL